MNHQVWLFLFSMLFSLLPYSTLAADEPTKADARKPSHCHDKSGEAHAAHGHTVSCAGQSGKASRVARTIRMQALDTMRYVPETLTVKSGQTVRLSRRGP